MDDTTLVFNDWTSDMIKIVNGSKFTMRDVHLTRSTPGATQGFVKEVRDNEIIMEIPSGKLTLERTQFSIIFLL